MKLAYVLFLFPGLTALGSGVPCEPGECCCYLGPLVRALQEQLNCGPGPAAAPQGCQCHCQCAEPGRGPAQEESPPGHELEARA